MEFEKVLKMRQSVRKYQDRPLSDEQIGKLLEAANRAPVGSNLYRDIHLTVVRDQEVLLKLCEAAWKRFADRKKLEEIEGDMDFRKEDREKKMNLFYGASVVIFISHREQTVQPGIEYSNVASIANQIHLAATDMGLGSCYMWGALESMRMLPELDHTELLGVPEGFHPLLGVAAGYPAEELSEHEIRHKPVPVNYVG